MLRICALRLSINRVAIHSDIFQNWQYKSCITMTKNYSIYLTLNSETRQSWILCITDTISPVFWFILGAKFPAVSFFIVILGRVGTLKTFQIESLCMHVQLIRSSCTTNYRNAKVSQICLRFTIIYFNSP